MAIYHLSAKIIGRSRGRSATSAAAYRAGVRIHDIRTGITSDYARRKHVVWRAIAVPEHASSWVMDREQLWNIVEQTERRRDAQVAREIEIALPLELDHLSQLKLIAEFVEVEFTSRGMVADIAVHNNPNNPHCHILLTMRQLLPDGFGAKVTAWNDKALLKVWRESWATHCNRELGRNGICQRIDHRSLVAQGIAHRIAGKHEGGRRRAMFRRSISRIKQNQSKGESIVEAKTKDMAASADKKVSVPSGGISPVDNIERQASKEQVASEEYHEGVRKVFGDRLHGIQYYDDFHSLHVRIKGGSLRDFGDRVVPKFGGISGEISAMIELAQLKGWSKIAVAGAEHCRQGLWREAVAKGYKPDDILGYTPTVEDFSVVSNESETPKTPCKTNVPQTARRTTFRR
jgi:hypothetical protein